MRSCSSLSARCMFAHLITREFVSYGDVPRLFFHLSFTPPLCYYVRSYNNFQMEKLIHPLVFLFLFCLLLVVFFHLLYVLTGVPLASTMAKIEFWMKRRSRKEKRRKTRITIIDARLRKDQRSNKTLINSSRFHAIRFITSSWKVNPYI